MRRIILCINVLALYAILSARADRGIRVIPAPNALESSYTTTLSRVITVTVDGVPATQTIGSVDVRPVPLDGSQGSEEIAEADDHSIEQRDTPTLPGAPIIVDLSWLDRWPRVKMPYASNPGANDATSVWFCQFIDFKQPCVPFYIDPALKFKPFAWSLAEGFWHSQQGNDGRLSDPATNGSWGFNNANVSVGSIGFPGGVTVLLTDYTGSKAILKVKNAVECGYGNLASDQAAPPNATAYYQGGNLINLDGYWNTSVKGFQVVW